MNMKLSNQSEAVANKTRQYYRATIGCPQASQIMCRPDPRHPSFHSAPPLHQLPHGRGERPDRV